MEENIDVVGVLANDEEIKRVMGRSTKSSIFIPSSGVLHYHIKKLSKEKINTYSADENYFMGYISCIKGYFEEENTGLSGEDRIAQFQNFIEQFVLIFHYIQPGAVLAPFCKVSDMSVVKKPKNFQRNTVYGAIPIFQPYQDTEIWEREQRINLKRDYGNIAAFIKKILEHEETGKVVGMCEPEKNREIILWQDAENILAIGPFTEWKYGWQGFELGSSKPLQVYPLSKDIMDQLIMVHSNPTLAHLPTSLIHAIKEIMQQQRGIPLEEFVEKSINNQVKEYLESAQWKKEVPKLESSIIEAMEYCCQKEELFYVKEDLINFHIAMKMDSLVILSGMSGIGKSSLAEIYAKAIGAKFLNIPVRPAWNDDTDLLGYYDVMHHTYCPAENQFVSFLAEAWKRPEQMYIVCLDEMNLSHVEHYFAQFLSVMEKEERMLQLYDSSLEEETSNKEQYPALLPLKDNVRILGTVNIDETTYHFSDKVLDRANVLQLQVQNYARPVERKFFIDWKPSSWDSREYNDNAAKDVSRDYPLRSCLWELNEVLLENGLNSGVGPRVVKKIEEYLANIPLYGSEKMLETKKAIDLQIAQRILTKLRGREEKLGVLLSQDTEENNIENILDKYSQLSRFENSRKILERKRKELNIYGYCV